MVSIVSVVSVSADSARPYLPLTGPPLCAASCLPAYAADLRESVKQDLLKWKESFAATHGRAPNRTDLETDPTGRALFQEYQRLSRLEWPEDMK